MNKLKTVWIGQSVIDALRLQNSVQTIRVEAMMEAILARMFRTEIDEAERVRRHPRTR